MYYLNLSDDGYLLSTSSMPMVDCPSIESLDGLDLSGVRIGAYHWDGQALTLDADRLAQLEREQAASDKAMRQADEKAAAMVEVQAALVTAQINTLSVDDTTAMRWKLLYPDWATNTKYETDMKVQYNDRLYRCLQPHTSQAGWEPVNVPALWTEISETHSGDINDPIPYNNNMALENGKYYIQDGVKYRCFRDTGIPVYNALAELVGLYVEVAD